MILFIIVELLLHITLCLHKLLKRFDYVLYVFNKLSHYCSRFPLFNKSIRYSKINYSLNINTPAGRSYTYLMVLHNLFYIAKNNFIKTINFELLPYLECYCSSTLSNG